MGHGDWKDMFLAVQNNDIELVRYYISKGIDLNYQHPEFMTSPLVESIRCRNLEMIKFLLNNGALPHLKEVESLKTPLEIAKDAGYQPAIELLQHYLNV